MRLTAISLGLLVVVSVPAKAEPPSGFTALFNGKDLGGWKATGDMKVWGAEDGVLSTAAGAAG